MEEYRRERPPVDGRQRSAEQPSSEGRDRALEHMMRDKGLTPAEQSVLRVLLHGTSNAQIARALFVSTETVRTHLRHIYRKLGVRSRLEAVTAVRDALDRDRR